MFRFDGKSAWLHLQKNNPMHVGKTQNKSLLPHKHVLENCTGNYDISLSDVTVKPH